MKAWMATYEEVKADAEGTDGSEAIGPCVTEVMAEEQKAWERELEGYELAERYGEV